mgnify:CR=1 FL=1
MQYVRFSTIVCIGIAAISFLSSFRPAGLKNSSRVNDRDTLIPLQIRKEISESVRQAMKEIQSADLNKINNDLQVALSGIDFARINSETQKALESIRWNDVQNTLNKAMKNINAKELETEIRNSLREAQLQLEKATQNLRLQNQKPKQQKKDSEKQKTELQSPENKARPASQEVYHLSNQFQEDRLFPAPPFLPRI